MSKKKVNVRELVNRYQENCERINEIADTCEKEQRERTDAETAEFKTLTRENELLQMKMQAAAATQYGVDAPAVDTDAVLRENLLNKGQKVKVTLMRTVTPQTTAALAETGVIPVSQQEMLEPVRKGLIWDKVGITVRYGLAGKLRWPVHGKAVASFADEAERLVDSKVEFSKLEMSGSRMGIAIPVTKEELEDSVGIVESIIRSEAPAAIVDLINDSMFTTDPQYTAASGSKQQRKVVGPFIEAKKSVTKLKTALPTRKDLLAMVSAVAEKVNMIAPCWVMTEAMKNELRDVKVDAGSGRFLCENDMILGYPVFCTQSIGKNYIGFGDWSYQAAGFFGEMNFIADPYTLARQNSVDFVLNGRFGTATLRKEAFVLCEITPAMA